MASVELIVFLVLSLLSPAILGAILRLICRRTHGGSLGIAVGVLFTFFQPLFGSDQFGLLFRINEMQKHDVPTEAMNAMIVMFVVVRIGVFALIASLGIRLIDKIKGSQQPQQGES